MTNAKNPKRLRPVALAIRKLSPLVAASLMASNAHAMDLSSEDSDLKFRWDNTFRYSTMARTLKASKALISNDNQDDGDRSFTRGFVSNRVDLFSEADLTYQKFGARVSAAGWYDAAYNRGNQNDSPVTVNADSVPTNEFTKKAREVMGRKIELLDAFVFGSTQVGDMGLSGRLGRHSLLWGEALFFGNNAISGSQAGLDIIKAAAVPSSTVKEIVRPDNQISGLFQLNSDMSFGAYYKFSWEENRLPVAGSYLANGDLVNGGERFRTSNGAYVPRLQDFKPKESGQYGFSYKWRPADTDLDLGAYAINYHDRNPSALYIVTAPVPGVPRPVPQGYRVAYAQNIKAYGLSANTAVGGATIGGEVSIRKHAALATDPQAVAASANADNDQNPAYAIGNTAHINVSTLWNVSPNFIAGESSFSGEVAWNRTLSVSNNPGAKAILSDRDAWGFRAVYTPTYRQALSGLDLSVPMGVSYFPRGRSSAVAGFGVDHGGDYSIGVTGAYLDVWRFSLTYTGFYGPEGVFLRTRPAGVPPGGNILSFDQSLHDRNFLAFSLSRTL